MSNTLAAGGSTLSGFGHDWWWLIIVKILIVFLFLVITTMLQIWAERRILGRMQLRPGPNRAGPFGLLQSVADAIKLGLKEDIVPRGVDKLIFALAPIISGGVAFISFAIIPFGPQVSIGGKLTHLQITDLPVAVLLVLAMSSMGVYGIVLAGWSSRSPYAILGGLRSSAQVISYEIAMGLSFVAVFLYAGSMSTSQIVNSQQHLWFGLILFPSFVIYLITMVGETNRLPFDLPEGEGELVGGFHTEYSSMRFAMFYLGEYINMTTVAGLAVTLFLGGWRAPWPLSLWAGANHGWWPILWFLIKLGVVLWGFYWLRATLPRVRYDQLMRLGWKALIPISLAWIVFVATIRALRNDNWSPGMTALAGIAMVIVLFAIFAAVDSGRERKAAATVAADEADFAARAADPMYGGYPVPPIDAPHYGAQSRASRGDTPRDGTGPTAVPAGRGSSTDA